MAAQAPTQAGQGNCAQGRTIPWHARAKGEGAQAGWGWHSLSRGDCRGQKGGHAVPPATLACTQMGGWAGGTAHEWKVGAVPSARKEGEAEGPPCASSMHAKAWQVCGRGGACKPGVGGGATPAEGIVRERRGGGWHTVRAVPPARAQRGGWGAWLGWAPGAGARGGGGGGRGGGSKPGVGGGATRVEGTVCKRK